MLVFPLSHQRSRPFRFSRVSCNFIMDSGRKTTLRQSQMPRISWLQEPRISGDEDSGCLRANMDLKVLWRYPHRSLPGVGQGHPGAIDVKSRRRDRDTQGGSFFGRKPVYERQKFTGRSDIASPSEAWPRQFFNQLENLPPKTGEIRPR